MRKLKYTIAIFIVLLLSAELIQAQVNNQQSASELSLSQAIEKTLANNYGIILSEQNIATSEISNSWGQAGRYPSIDLSLSSVNNLSTSSDVSTGINRITGGANLRWTLFNGFKVNLTKEKLESLEELAHGSSGITIENTIQDLIEAYYIVLLQTERYMVYAKMMEVSKDRLDAEEERRDLGGSVTYEVLKSKNLYLNDQYNLLNQEILIKSSFRNLNFIMAEDSDANWILTESFEHRAEEYISDDLVQKALSNNKTLKNQYLYLQLSKSAVKLADAAYFPSVSLSTGADNGFTNQFTINQGNSTGNTFTPYANLTLSYNLYSGGARKRAQQIAEVEKETSEIEIVEMKHFVSNQLKNELDAYNVTKIQLEVATESLEAAELNLDIAAEKLRSGAINSFNYRDIQVIYLNTAIQKLQATYALIRLHTNLTRLIGGIVTE